MKKKNQKPTKNKTVQKSHAGIDRRKKNVEWMLDTNRDGTTPTLAAHLAVLMDIRDELKAIRVEIVTIGGHFTLGSFMVVLERISSQLDTVNKRKRKK